MALVVALNVEIIVVLDAFDFVFLKELLDLPYFVEVVPDFFELLAVALVLLNLGLELELALFLHFFYFLR